MTGQASKVSAQVWTFPGSWRMSACQGVNLGGFFGFFLISPRLARILKPTSTKPPRPRSSCKQKGWMTSPSKTVLFPHHDDRSGIKIQPCGSAKHHYVDRPRREGFKCCVGKDEGGGPIQDDRVGTLIGMVWHSITIYNKSHQRDSVM